MTTGSFPHDNFSSVYWIFNKLGHMIPLWKGRTTFIFGSFGQGHRYYKYNFFQQDRFRTITLVLYIGSLPSLFILGSLPIYRLIIYIDGRILWCTHFLFFWPLCSLIFFDIRIMIAPLVSSNPSCKTCVQLNCIYLTIEYLYKCVMNFKLNA